MCSLYQLYFNKSINKERNEKGEGDEKEEGKKEGEGGGGRGREAG